MMKSALDDDHKILAPATGKADQWKPEGSQFYESLKILSRIPDPVTNIKKKKKKMMKSALDDDHNILAPVTGKADQWKPEGSLFYESLKILSRIPDPAVKEAKSIGETCQICGHVGFTEWGLMCFYCDGCLVAMADSTGDDDEDDCVYTGESLIKAGSLAHCKLRGSQFWKLFKTLDNNQKMIMIKSTLDDIKFHNRFTNLCSAPGKAEPLSQCEPKGSQFLESLKTLNGDHNQGEMVAREMHMKP